MQLAPDQKIYFVEPFKMLGAINSPNTKGAGCNFKENQIDVTGQSSATTYAGLPSFINDLSFDGNNGFTYTITDSCNGTVQFNGFTVLAGTLIWSWDFGDGFTASTQNPVHSFSSARDIYKVKVTIQSAGGCGMIKRSKQVIPKGIFLDPAFDQVAKCDSGYIRFINNAEFFPDTASVKYSWDFGDGGTSTDINPKHSYLTGGIYNVQLKMSSVKTACVFKTITKPVAADVLDIHITPANVEIDLGDAVQLNVTGGGTRFVWTPINGLSDPKIANPVAKPTNYITYKVTAYNDAGCADTDSIQIKIRPVPGVYVPSGFTPNNDGKNDLFKPILSEEFSLVNFSVYNRWGQIIFTTTQKDAGWNGKIDGVQQDAGVYVVVVNAIDTRTNSKIKKKGTFVLIR